MNSLIEKFINDSNLSNLKQTDIITGVVLEDEFGDKMIISKPLMTENLIEVSFDDFKRLYQYKKGIDNNYNWFIVD